MPDSGFRIQFSFIMINLPVYNNIAMSVLDRLKAFLPALPLALLLALLSALPLLASTGTVSANLLGGDDPLAAEQAFVPEVAAISSEHIELTFSIVDGYFLYRDKLSFSTEDIRLHEGRQSATSSLFDPIQPTSGATELVLAAPEYPEAVQQHDDYFGLQAVYREQVTISLPYTAGQQVQGFTLGVTFQGCADMGLCYPPTQVRLHLDLPAEPPSSRLDAGSAYSPVSVSASPLKNTPANNALGIDSLLQADDFELLPPELAYLPQVISASEEGIHIRWTIEDGYYLYRDKTSFTLNNNVQIDKAATLISQGVDQYDEFFGDVKVLRHSADARIALSRASNSNPGHPNAELTISYQGCADIGVCFPPSTTTLPVIFSATDSRSDNSLLSSSSSSLPGNGASGSDLLPMGAASAVSVATSGAGQTTRVASSTTQASTDANGIPAQSEQDRLMSLLASNSLWLSIVTFFGLGLLLAFTPCVLPMIPILSSMIVGQGQSMSTGRAFRLSLVYVLVMASTYAAVGVIVGLSGYNIQAFLQNPWVLSAIAGLFVLLALSMFGFYQFQMPAGIQTKLTQWSQKQGGGQVGSVAAMGFISSLIVGPCITAPLAGALIYIAKTGDALIGGAALFSLGMGMGAPLLLIGTSAGKLVPRTGAWMNMVQRVFGILLLAMAIYMLSRFLPVQVIMTLSGILALMSGVYLGATDSTTRDSSGWQRFGKGAGLVTTLYGAALLVGAFAGSSSYTTPLRGIVGTESNQTEATTVHALPFQLVKSPADLQEVIARASSQSRPVMLDFYADWCISCKEMEAFTFTDKRVQDLLANAIVVQADVTANDASDQALLKQFDLFGPPGIIFYDSTGKELTAARVVGFMNADNFSQHIERFIGNHGTTLSMR